MNIDQAIEKFAPGVKFSQDKKFFEVKTVKKVNGNLVIITNARTFNLLPSSIDEFVNSVDFNVYEMESKMNYQPDFQLKNTNPFMDDIWLPQGSAKAKDAMEKMLDLFADPHKVDAETIKTANALCMISDKIVSIERLQLDYAKLQTK